MTMFDIGETFPLLSIRESVSLGAGLTAGACFEYTGSVLHLRGELLPPCRIPDVVICDASSRCLSQPRRRVVPDRVCVGLGLQTSSTEARIKYPPTKGEEKHAVEEYPTKTNCHKAVIEADAVEKCRANGHSTDWQEGDFDGSVKKERR
ncbi:hypothetical protein TSMEX_009115 [Taenia solium]|eukprot:TsM_000581500 transcript=TsM_000581500 gene=TsM_000581500